MDPVYMPDKVTLHMIRMVNESNNEVEIRGQSEPKFFVNNILMSGQYIGD